MPMPESRLCIKSNLVFSAFDAIFGIRALGDGFLLGFPKPTHKAENAHRPVCTSNILIVRSRRYRRWPVRDHQMQVV